MRFHLLCLTCLIVAQTVPQCPPMNTTPPPSGDRGEIETSASGAATALPGVRVTLLAQVADDSDGVTFSWAQVSGPGVVIEDAGESEASFVAPSLRSNRTLGFIVTTTNAAGDAGQAGVQVEVAADPNFIPDEDDDDDNGGTPTPALPVARAGADRDAQELETVFLDAGASTGEGLAYSWSQIRGQSVALMGAATSEARFDAPAPATPGAEVEFELSVTDRFGRVSSDAIVVTLLPTEQSPDEMHPRVRIRTSLGNLVVELDRENAPITVDNFLEYVDDEFYDGTIFHRVIAGFVVQGGGFQPGLVEKETRDPIENESDNGLSNERGTIAMARTMDLNSATSQFYVNLRDNTALDATSGANGYTVFGRVIQGMDVIDQIATQPTETRQGFSDVPVTDVRLIEAELIPVEAEVVP